VTTPKREVFFVEGEEGADTSHTAAYISRLLFKVHAEELKGWSDLFIETFPQR
jgi:hypothetical protein